MKKRNYNCGYTELLQLRVTPQLAALLRGMPGGYNNYTRELILKDLKDNLDQILIENANSKKEAPNAMP